MDDSILYSYVDNWDTDDKKFAFTFDISIAKYQKAEVEVTLNYVRLSYIKKLLINKEKLIAGAENILKIKNGVQDHTIEGDIKAYFEDKDGINHFVIWGELYFGDPDDRSHFIGPMSVKQIGKINTSEFPVYDNESEIIGEDDNIISRRGDYDMLFPYINLYHWPVIESSILKLCFVLYEPISLSPPANMFYNNLLQSKAKNNYYGIINQAITFIEGREPYENIYVRSKENLKCHIPEFLSFISNIGMSGTYSDIPGQFSNSYNITADEVYAILKSTEYIQQKESVWSSYFATIIIPGYNNSVTEFLTEVLVACNVFEQIFLNLGVDKSQPPFTSEQIDMMIRATVMLPSDLFPLPEPICSPPKEYHGYAEVFAIGNLHQVKQKLVRYMPGDISDIVSVMPGERRKKTKREQSKHSSVSANATADNNSVSDNTDNINEAISGEIINVLAHSQDVYTYNNLNTTYGPPTNLKINGDYNVERKIIDPAKKSNAAFAQRVIHNATTNIARYVNKERIIKSENEYEESYESVVDNSNNREPINGVYYWLNKLYRAKLLSCGYRLMLKVTVKNPAKEFIQQEHKLKNQELKEILSPDELFNIKQFTDITRDNYIAACTYYNVPDIDLPPDENRTVSVTLCSDESKTVTVPEGYYAYKAHIACINGGDTSTSSVDVAVGAAKICVDIDSSNKVHCQLNREDDAVVISAVSHSGYLSPPVNSSVIRINVVVECLCGSTKLNSWRKTMYKTITNYYQYAREQYYTNIYSNNYRNSYYKQAVNNLLRNLGVDSFARYARCNSVTETEQAYYNRSNVNQFGIVDFLNCALEWSELNYSIKSSDNTPFIKADTDITNEYYPVVFTAFLQASEIEIIVPVRQRFNHSLLYYLQTGLIWSAKERFAPAFHNQASLIYEIKRLAGKNINDGDDIIIDTWEFEIPTSLQMLKKESNLF